MTEMFLEEMKAAREVPPPIPIIVIKKITMMHPHAHHGGAWKVAYADFVTAMMAFFLLLWIVGATSEDQRKGIADYFTPTLIQQQNSGGSNGIMGGRSIQAPDGNAPNPAQSKKAANDPVVTTGSFGRKEGPGATGPSTREGLGPAQRVAEAELDRKRAADALDEASFRAIQSQLQGTLTRDPALAGLKDQVRFVRTHDGLRIELIDRARFSMFGVGTDHLNPKAERLLRTVARGIAGLPNRLAVRGHTDARLFAGLRRMNNWLLSAQRAEATRAALAAAGIDSARFARIEGVAAGEPFNASNPLDPSNRRISVTLLWQAGERGL